MVVVDNLIPGSATSSQPVPTVITSILTEYADVFAEPKELPPHRQYDHAISLEEGTVPPNTKPYRYSPIQKDEIGYRFRRC
jgi:hypothetical protein